jgi:NADP-dependent 3-hydroxy acid dehydrogenase YdfG
VPRCAALCRALTEHQTSAGLCTVLLSSASNGMGPRTAKALRQAASKVVRLDQPGGPLPKRSKEWK